MSFAKISAGYLPLPFSLLLLPFPLFCSSLYRSLLCTRARARAFVCVRVCVSSQMRQVLQRGKDQLAYEQSKDGGQRFASISGPAGIYQDQYRSDLQQKISPGHDGLSQKHEQRGLRTQPSPPLPPPVRDPFNLSLSSSLCLPPPLTTPRPFLSPNIPHPSPSLCVCRGLVVWMGERMYLKKFCECMHVCEFAVCDVRIFTVPSHAHSLGPKL